MVRRRFSPNHLRMQAPLNLSPLLDLGFEPFADGRCRIQYPENVLLHFRSFLEAELIIVGPLKCFFPWLRGTLVRGWLLSHVRYSLLKTCPKNCFVSMLQRKLFVNSSHMQLKAGTIEVCVYPIQVLKPTKTVP